MLKGAIFDMDGLLFDTELVYNEEWYKIADAYGLKIESEMLDRLRGTNGDLMNRIVNEYWPMINAKELTDALFENARISLTKHVPLKPGAHELLTYLKQQGVKLAVASSAPMELIKNNLAVAKMDAYFDEVVSGQQVMHGKPAPDIFNLAAEKLHLDPKECYVLEDGIHGAYAGIAAGCSTIMVPDLLQPTLELRKKCTGIFSNLFDVMDAIKHNIC